MIDLEWKDADEIKDYIPMDKCKDGWLYSIAARNATLGIYREKELGFETRRVKFCDVFSFVEYHWDVGTVKPELEQYGTAKPIQEIEKSTTLLNEKEFLKYMENKHKEFSNEQ